MNNENDLFSLEQRSRLPEPLRVLIEDYPRDAWTGHNNFNDLVQFWLERHVGFRRLVKMLLQDAANLEQKSLDPVQYRQRLGRLGNMLVGELHMHHNIEDHHYFPQLQRLETKLENGFAILDKDHHALDHHLEDFTTLANTALNASDTEIITEALKLQEKISAFETFLDRHLTDEEELIVPVILKHGFSG